MKEQVSAGLVSSSENLQCCIPARHPCLLRHSQCDGSGAIARNRAACNNIRGQREQSAGSSVVSSLALSLRRRLRLLAGSRVWSRISATLFRISDKVGIAYKVIIGTAAKSILFSFLIRLAGALPLNDNIANTLSAGECLCIIKDKEGATAGLDIHDDDLSLLFSHVGGLQVTG